MDTNTLKTALIEVIKKQLGKQAGQITLDANTSFDDLGADSLDVVEILFATEERFDLEIADDDAQTLTSPQRLYDYLLAKMS